MPQGPGLSDPKVCAPCGQPIKRAPPPANAWRGRPLSIGWVCIECWLRCLRPFAEFVNQYPGRIGT